MQQDGHREATGLESLISIWFMILMIIIDNIPIYNNLYIYTKDGFSRGF